MVFGIKPRPDLCEANALFGLALTVVLAHGKFSFEDLCDTTGNADVAAMLI